MSPERGSFLYVRLFCAYDEWTKKYVPGRHMSIAEMGINIAGAAIGVGIILILTV